MANKKKMSKCRVCGLPITSGYYCSDVCRKIAEFRRHNAMMYFLDRYIEEYGMGFGKQMDIEYPESMYSAELTDRERDYVSGMVNRRRITPEQASQFFERMDP